MDAKKPAAYVGEGYGGGAAAAEAPEYPGHVDPPPLYHVEVV